MIRDSLMEQLIAPHQEPITPYLYRARTLHEQLGVSCILVIGGSGEYFRVADRVLVMDSYVPRERTDEARRIVEGRGAIPADPGAAELFRRSVAGERELPVSRPARRSAVRCLDGLAFRLAARFSRA